MSSSVANSTNNSCLFSSTQSQHIILQTLTIAAAVGLTSSVISIIIVLATRSYNRFVRRLYLYLALASALISIGQFTYWGNTEWYTIYWVTHFAYGLIIYCLLIAWVSVYVFVLIVCRVQLKRERVVLPVILLAPLTICWIPALVLGLSWSRAICIAGLALLPISVVIVVMCLVSIAALAAVLVVLFRAIFRMGTMFPAHHKKVLKEVLPVFALVLLVQVAGVLLLVIYAFYATVGVGIYSQHGYLALVYALPAVFVVVPVLLILDLFVCSRSVRASNARAEEGSTLITGSESVEIQPVVSRAYQNP